MTEYRMPEPPAGHFWRVRAKYIGLGFYKHRVELRQKWWRWSICVERREFSEEDYTPKQRAELAVRCAERALRSWKTDHAYFEDGFDFNGLSGVEFGRKTNGDAKRAASVVGG